jgi:hypothetical protein
MTIQTFLSSVIRAGVMPFVNRFDSPKLVSLNLYSTWPGWDAALFTEIRA